jgi:hypothetical protein
VESDDDDHDDDFEEEEDQVEVLRTSLHPKVTKSVKKEPTPPPTVVTRRRSGKTMEVSLPRTMPHIRVEGPIPSTPVLSVSKGSRSSNKKGKTPASGSKTKAKTSHTPKLVLSRTSLEAEIPNISARELEEVSASAETPLVSPFDFFFLFISFHRNTLLQPVFMCANCVAHNYNDCQFRGWNVKCNRCDSARRPGCTFSLSPSHRSHTNALLAVVSQDAVTGKFPRVFLNYFFI